MATCKVDELADEISKSLEDYAGAVAENVNDAAFLAARSVNQEIQNRAAALWPMSEYMKGWTVSRNIKKKGKRYNPAVSYIVHNKTHYRIAHLLEKGHAKVNGGRTREFPHILPAAENGEAKFLSELRRRIEVVK